MNAAALEAGRPPPRLVRPRRQPPPAARAGLAVHAGSGLRKLARHLTDPLRTAASEAVARPRALPVLGMIARSRALGGALSEALAGGAVWPGTEAEVSGGDLGSVLAGGRFTVTGSCVFSPATPFNPAPTAADYDPDRAFVADERFAYSHPPR